MLLRSEEKSSPGVYESLLVTALGRRGRRRVGHQACQQVRQFNQLLSSITATQNIQG